MRRNEIQPYILQKDQLWFRLEAEKMESEIWELKSDHLPCKV